MKYSFSTLNCFRNCPRQFKFQYIERPAIPSTVNPNSYLGTAVHHILQKLYTLGADGIVIPREDALAAYHAKWDELDRESIKLVKDYYTIDDYIRIGKEMLTAHYDKYQPFRHNVLLGTELWLKYTLPGTLFEFSGKIDKLCRREDGTVEIYDYKTGGKLPKPVDPEFRIQMGIYQLGVESLYPDYNDIEVIQFSLRHDEMIRYRIGPDEIEQLTEDLRVTVINILEAIRTDNFPPDETGLCDYCKYNNLCPAKRHRRMLDEAETEETDSSLNPAEKIKNLADAYLEKHKEHKAISDELDDLKKKVKEIAQEHNLTKLSGDTGDVNVTIENVEKFITKSKDARAFAELSYLARKLKLDDYFTLDAGSLMKEIVIKQRLPEDQLKQFKQFIVEKVASRISVKLRKYIDDEK